MNKIRKTMLALAPVIAAVAAAGMSIKCGGTKSGRFEQEDDGIVKVYAGFSSTNNQGKALKAVIDKYNEFIKDKTADEGYLPVKLVYAPNGYNTNELSQKLNSTDKKGLFNLMLNYPAAASIVSTYDMNLNIPDEIYGKLNLHEAFKNSNEGIAGNTNNEKWVLPVSRSSEMGAINKPVFGMLLKELQDNYGLKIAANGSEKLNKCIEAVATFTQDATEISTNIWKDKLNNADAKAKLKTEVEAFGEINDTVFESYGKILKLATFMKRAFPKSNDLYVIGADSLTNAFNSMNSSFTKGKGNFITKKSDDEFKKYGGYDFKSFSNKADSEEYKLFNKIADIIIDAINYKALYIGGGGAYGSNLLTNHKLAISYGSTAGYSHTFIKGSSQWIAKIDKSIDDDEYAIRHIYELKNKDGDELAKIYDGKYTNKIFLSTATTTGSHDLKSPDANVDAILNELSTNNKLVGGFITSDDSFKLDGDKVVYKKNNKEITGAKYLGYLKPGKKYDHFFIPAEMVKTVNLSGGQILNKEEADWISAPLKATGAANETAAVFTQGPSFITIHANEREDKGTLKFIEWFASHKFAEVELLSGKKFTNVTPIDAFNRSAGYISPTVEYFAQTSQDLKLNVADTIAFENFKKIDNVNVFTAEDIASPYSSQMRDAITNAGKALVAARNTNTPISFAKFLESFNAEFSAVLN